MTKKRSSYQPEDKLMYDLRFQSFMHKLMNISNLSPKEDYLYRLMDTVAYQDFETAMSGTILDFADVANDNQI